MPRNTAIVSPCAFFNEALNATVVLHPRCGTRSFRARWKGAEVHISIPKAASMAHVSEFISHIETDIIRLRPTTPYHDGYRIDFHEGSIIIRSDKSAQKFSASTHYDQSSSQYHITISAPASTDFSDIATGVYITRIILNRIRPVARQILLDTAATIATETGCHPSAWSISSGRRVLGSCNSYRIIRLSIYLLFLPLHLRRYIICHELAHLSEMNHSPAFHRIADKYCNGNERSWATELKTFKWPVMR